MVAKGKIPSISSLNLSFSILISASVQVFRGDLGDDAVESVSSNTFLNAVDPAAAFSYFFT